MPPGSGGKRDRLAPETGYNVPMHDSVTIEAARARAVNRHYGFPLPAGARETLSARGSTARSRVFSKR
ncbi:MAG: hypothetical protein OXG03_00525 [Gammaproteobacteria bacterium]|nr:hypothetical protein [Gammaproteobacteria bacterium]